MLRGLGVEIAGEKVMLRGLGLEIAGEKVVLRGLEVTIAREIPSTKFLEYFSLSRRMQF